jgi:hypothetical protein
MNEDLPDLAKEVKKIWLQSDEWRRNNGSIEYSLGRSDGNKEWFPYCIAPFSVQKYVTAWEKLNATKRERREDRILIKKFIDQITENCERRKDRTLIQKRREENATKCESSDT